MVPIDPTVNTLCMHSLPCVKLIMACMVSYGSYIYSEISPFMQSPLNVKLILVCMVSYSSHVYSVCIHAESTKSEVDFGLYGFIFFPRVQ